MKTPFDPEAFAENMTRAGELWHTIAHEILTGEGVSIPAMMDPMHIQQQWAEAAQVMFANPQGVMQLQNDMLQDYAMFWQHTVDRMLGKSSGEYIAPDAKDRRFRDDAWNESFVYDMVKQHYLMAQKWMQRSVQAVAPSDSHKAKKLNFFTQQYLDALAPTNFLSTNPEVIRTLLESNGASLVHGLEMLLEDFTRNNGKLKIRTTDTDAFTIGENIACTPGKVVLRNGVMELIQYAPMTETVFKKPLLVMPAWINKFYILDLQPHNSFVKWATEQGHTVFVISWVNPDADIGRRPFEDYMIHGPLAAMDRIYELTSEPAVNMMGYCLGGTLQAITLSYLQHSGYADRVASATYLTTLIDFRNCGDIDVFIDKVQIDALEARMSERGYLESDAMATTFNMLRSNDMIWSFVVNNYLLGKDPFPFDLLYWNADATRMPANAHAYYLRHMYEKNELVVPGALEMAGEPINVSKIQTPSYILATKEDHIAPWQSTYVATQLYDGPVQFTLAESGHVAGVISSPHKQKYGYYSNSKVPSTAERWFSAAKKHDGSWWEHWQQWMKPYVGSRVKAREIALDEALCDAPGEYVLVKS